MEILFFQSQMDSYDPETVPDKVQTRIETRFRFRIEKPEFPVSGFRFRLGVPCCRSLPARSLPWRLPISGFSSFYHNFPHFSTFFPIFTIFLHVSPFPLPVSGFRKSAPKGAAKQHSSESSKSCSRAPKAVARAPAKQ